jgi:hypothetical protein
MPLETHEEVIMKNINAPQPLASGSPVSRFQAARAMAFTYALSDPGLLEPELIAWHDRTTSMTSPVLEGCSGPYGWRDYCISHNGRLEVDVGGGATFIFAESSPFDSYEHFSPGPYINIRDAQGVEMICRAGGGSCMPIDDWTSKLT